MKETPTDRNSQPPLTPEQVTVLEVERLNSMGEGVAHPEGFACFVPGLYAGDQAVVRITKVARSFARAHPLQLKRSHPDRQIPVCPFHIQPDPQGIFPSQETCGGCLLQALPRQQQLDFKRGIVLDNLSRIADLKTEVQPTIGGKPYGYRNKMAFSMTMLDGHLSWGLRSLEEGASIVPLSSCQIADPSLWEQAQKIIEVLDSEFGGKLVWDGNQGFIRAATLRVHTGKRADLVSEMDRASTTPCFVALFAVTRFDTSLAMKIKETLACLSKVRVFFSFSDTQVDGVFFDRGRFLNLLPGREPFWGEAIYREEQVAWHTTGDWCTLVGPTSFLQVNDEMAEKLYRAVLDLPFSGSGYAVDVYCGVGILTRALPQKFERVMGVELETQSIKLARTTSRRLNDCRVEWVAEPAEALFSRATSQGMDGGRGVPDCVILDPPRKGCQKEVLQALLDMKPADVVYISCHPAALARDLQFLCRSHYTIASVQPFDLFPQTHHVETLVHLKRKG